VTAIYQDDHTTITTEGISVGRKTFTMNLLNNASVKTSSSSIGYVNSLLNAVSAFFDSFLFGNKNRLPKRQRTRTYHLVINIAGSETVVLSNKDREYIHMLAKLINTFKGYTPEPDPSFDYEGEVLE
jgi:hypothetical protein